MDTPEQPQIYLITSPEFELSTFPTALARVLDAHPVACVRLAMATRDEDRLLRAADALREVTMSRDVALVVAAGRGTRRQLGGDGRVTGAIAHVDAHRARRGAAHHLAQAGAA